MPRGSARIGESQRQCAALELLDESGLSVASDTRQRLGHVRRDTGILRGQRPVDLARLSACTQWGQRDKEARNPVIISIAKLRMAMRHGLTEDRFTLAPFAVSDVSSGRIVQFSLMKRAAGHAWMNNGLAASCVPRGWQQSIACNEPICATGDASALHRTRPEAALRHGRHAVRPAGHDRPTARNAARGTCRTACLPPVD